MLRYLLRNAGFVSMLREEVRIHDCIIHYQYPTDHGMQLVWTLFWVCQKLKEEMTPFMLLWIDFIKWRILLHARKQVMQHILLICFFRSCKITWITCEYCV